MSEIFPRQHFHKAGHDRDPGPDPVPIKRRSTEPQKDQADTPTSVSTPASIPATTSAPDTAAKARKGKGCGSRKPRYALTQALIKKALAEGYYEILEEREEERLAEQQSASESDPNAAAGQDSEPRFIVSCIVGEDGQEKLHYHPVGGKAAANTEQKTKPIEDVLAERKVRQLLESMKEIQISINVGELVQAAKQDPKLYKMLQETKLPSYKGRSPKVNSNRTGHVKVPRPSLSSSHNSTPGNKEKGSRIQSTMTTRSKAERRKFH